jgi:predicted metalloendopeptidase
MKRAAARSSSVRRTLAAALLVALPAAAGSGGFEVSEMDTSVPACQDFYRYAVGGWLAKNPVPPEFATWGAFNELEERNRAWLRDILEKLPKDAAAGTEERKLADFWGACMDETAVEAAGAAPLQPELERIANLKSKAEIVDELARLHGYGVDALFQFGSEQDRKNAEHTISIAIQGGLGMPDRDYYTKTDAESKALVGKYEAHVAKMLGMLGETAERAKTDAKTIVALETRLAQGSLTRVERRDYEKTYNRMSGPALAKLTPAFSWTAYFRAIGVAPDTAVNVAHPKYFATLTKELETTPLAAWKTYLRWHLLHSAAPTLSSKFVDEDFDFYQRTLQGTKENLPRWKRCVSATDNALGMALGKIYVKEHFPPESKARMDTLVANLVAALKDDLATLPWMGEATRKAALEKLAAFRPKIGYPTKWRDYGALEVKPKAYAANVLAGSVFEFRRDLAKVGKPIDREDWEMTPPTVNAYYNATRNEIVFPAGILQPPFFDGAVDDALNYGAIGGVIGHEMTHGFDDQGRKTDAHGNLSNWWTKEDLANYEARAACVEKQFSGYEVEKGLKLTGKLVLGESIADLGGLTIAWRAFQKSREGKPEPPKIDGFTADQRFFLAWAREWATNDRPEFARMMATVNPHPLDRFRAVGAPSNLPEFAKAFSCKAGDPMVRPEPCRIW